MSVFKMFNRFKKPIDIVGKQPEKAVFTRVGRSNSSNFKSNFVYTALLQDNTKIENGDIFYCTVYGKKRTFIVVSIRNAEGSNQATVYECNCVIDIYRLTPVYDDADNQTGNSLNKVLSTPANYVTVNASMRMLDAGLLPSTTNEFRMPKVDVQDMDRIVLDGKNLCVETVDRTKFYGMLAVQTSIDNR